MQWPNRKEREKHGPQPTAEEKGGRVLSDQQHLPHTWATQLLCYQCPTVAFRGLSDDTYIGPDMLSVLSTQTPLHRPAAPIAMRRASQPDPGAVADHAATAATLNKLSSATTGTGTSSDLVDRPTDPSSIPSLPTQIKSPHLRASSPAGTACRSSPVPSAVAVPPTCALPVDRQWWWCRPR